MVLFVVNIFQLGANCLINSCNAFTGSRYCNRPYDNHVGTRTSDRLQQTLHVPGYQYHDKEAHQTETWSVQLFEPFEQRDLGVRDILVHWRVHRAIYRIQVNIFLKVPRYFHRRRG